MDLKLFGFIIRTVRLVVRQAFRALVVRTNFLQTDLRRYPDRAFPFKQVSPYKEVGLVFMIRINDITKV